MGNARSLDPRQRIAHRLRESEQSRVQIAHRYALSIANVADFQVDPMGGVIAGMLVDGVPQSEEAQAASITGFRTEGIVEDPAQPGLYVMGTTTTPIVTTSYRLCWGYHPTEHWEDWLVVDARIGKQRPTLLALCKYVAQGQASNA